MTDRCAQVPPALSSCGRGHAAGTAGPSHYYTGPTPTVQSKLNTSKEDSLRVNGATLFYRVRGSGPLVLIFPGGDGDAEIGSWQDHGRDDAGLIIDRANIRFKGADRGRVG